MNILNIRSSLIQLNPIFLLMTMVFIGALLSFLMEPLSGRMLVPLFGGSIHVWLTCVMFFQAILLLGYLYSHFFVRRLGKWHLLILLLPLINLPFNISPVSNQDLPLISLLIQLFTSFALPFFVLSTTAVTSQVWLIMSKIGDAHEPYTLYAASNVGSFIGLLGYPLVVEPLFGVRLQTHIWAVLYLVYIIIVGVSWLRLRPQKNEFFKIDEKYSSIANKNPKTKEYFIWLVLSFLPSAFFMSVTNYIALEIGSFSLIWIVPLAIYLVSFTLTFRKNGGGPKIY